MNKLYLHSGSMKQVREYCSLTYLATWPFLILILERRKSVEGQGRHGVIGLGVALCLHQLEDGCAPRKSRCRVMSHHEISCHFLCMKPSIALIKNNTSALHACIQTG